MYLNSKNKPEDGLVLSAVTSNVVRKKEAAVPLNKNADIHKVIASSLAREQLEAQNAAQARSQLNAGVNTDGTSTNNLELEKARSHREIKAREELKQQQKDSLLAFLFSNGPKPSDSTSILMAQSHNSEAVKSTTRLEAATEASISKGSNDPFTGLTAKSLRSYPVKPANQTNVSIDWQELFDLKGKKNNVLVPPPPPPVMPYELVPPPLALPIEEVNEKESADRTKMLEVPRSDSAQYILVAIIGKTALFSKGGETIPVVEGGQIGAAQVMEVGSAYVKLLENGTTIKKVI